MGSCMVASPLPPSVYLFTFLVTSCPQKQPRPPPAKWRGLCPTAEELLVKPGLGEGGAGWEDLAVWVRTSATQGILGLISLLPVSA